MSQYRFKVEPGAEVFVGDRRYLITALLDVDTVLAKEMATAVTERLFIKDLRPRPAPAVTPARGELLELGEEALAEARRRLAIVQPLLDAPRCGRQAVAERGAEYGLSVATLYRWISDYRQTGLLSALLRKPRSDAGESRLSAEQETLLKATIQDFYLTPERPSLQQTYHEVVRRCRTAGLRAPHYHTLRGRIATLPALTRQAHRLGKATAEHHYTLSPGSFPGADWPYAVIQIDHTLLDIILVDEHYRLPIGRPWITLAIDVFSRMVAGYYLSFERPGALAVGLCLVNAILPKEPLLARYDIAASWPCRGLMDTVHSDNAKEFRGKMLRLACEEYGIAHAFRIVRKPQWGGHIERLLGTVLTELHRLPGTTFSQPHQRGEYPSEQAAIMTLPELERWLLVFLCEEYHQREHSELKTSPLQRCKEGVLGTAERPGRGIPPLIADEDKLKLDFMPVVERTIQEYGVVIDTIHYLDDALRRWVHARDPHQPQRLRQFIFKRDPRDISRIYFYDPEVKTYFPIRYRNLANPAISLWEFREVQRQLRQEGRRTIDEEAIFAGYEKRRQLEEQAQALTKQARRQATRRVSRPPATAVSAPPADPTATVAAAAIPPFDHVEDGF
jgi:putative transposase